MFSPRWMKLLRDIQLTPGKIMMMVLAISAGVAGLGIMLSTYTILTREIKQNYLDTHPASATLQLDRIDARLMDTVRAFPGIASAQASTRIGARISAGINARNQSGDGQWFPVTMFAVDDFHQWHINSVYPDAGAWPPPPGTILLEHDVLKMMHINIGDTLTIRNADGSSHAVTISGTTHDPGIPPPSQGNTVFAYVTPATLNAIGQDGALRSLEITVQDHPMDVVAIEDVTKRLALSIRASGYQIDSISIPPPGEHPHNRIMSAILKMLLVFSFVALVLSAVMTATILDSLLAQQLWQIGVMKTVGATTTQIAGIYLIFILCIGALASAIGVPAGIAAGRELARTILENLLNFSFRNGSVPAYVSIALIASGVLIPLCLAAIPILHTARTSIRTAIDNAAANSNAWQGNRFANWLDKIPGIDRSLLMALRNIFRRRGRLTLTLALLSFAGAMFISSLNVRKSSEDYLDEAARDREYDAEIFFSHPQNNLAIQKILAAVPGVARVEAWNGAAASVPRDDGLEIDRAYPDGAHGTLSLSIVPQSSQTIHLAMESGHWLNNETGAVVLNQAATRFYPGVKSDDEIKISSRGHIVTVRVVGITKQAMAGATLYTTSDVFEQIGGRADQASAFRIQMNAHDNAHVNALTRQIEDILELNHINTRLAITESMMRKEVDGHFNLLINALLAISVLMAGIGLFGLGSVMSANVTERTREFGIMRSIGASSQKIMRNVVIEGVFTGLLSCAIALVLTLPVSAAIGAFLGNLLFGMPFPFVISTQAIAIWFCSVLVGSLLASALPAWKASSLTIRESFVAIT